MALSYVGCARTLQWNKGRTAAILAGLAAGLVTLAAAACWLLR
jgi:hypothetical protein